MKYFIGEKNGFNTKTAAEKYTRSKMNEYGIGEYSEGAAYDFLTDLLNNHPEKEEKIGCGVKKIIVEKNYRGCFTTFILRTDWSIIDWSWVYCCQFKIRSVKNDLFAAMRYSIHDQTAAYKATQELKCLYCGTSEGEPYEFHVDHHNPSFKVIRNIFMEMHPEFPQSYTGGYGCLTCFKPEDTVYEKKFQDHHHHFANYQILCRQCNLSKPRN